MPKLGSQEYRVLTFDGTSASGGTGFIAIGLILEIQRHMKARGELGSILDQVDVFAGTSAGAVNAMLFAMHDSPKEALDHALDFWQGFTDVNRQGITVCREISTMLGQAALVSTEPLRDFLIAHFGRDTTLGMMKKNVIIPTFQLDNGDPQQRSWKPKVYANFADDEPDLNELVVDVILRSGSPPIMTPVYQGLSGTGPGFVDGGIYANNPALLAVTQVCAEMGRPLNSDRNILVLSIGNGDSPEFLSPTMVDGFADWGYAKWLFGSGNPGALLYMILESGLMAIDYECQTLLGDKYRRIDPCLTGRITVLEGSEILEAIGQVLALPNVQQRVKETADWLMKSEWLPARRSSQRSSLRKVKNEKKH